MRDLRIVSLLPAATEMVYALGLAQNLVGASGDSDFPPKVRKLPKVVATTLPPDLPSRQIDNRVRSAKHRGASIFHVDRKLLKKLRPNLILSQELCEVCAIGASEIKKAARILKGPVKTISLEPKSVSDIFENIRLVGSLTEKSKKAEGLIRSLQKRLKVIGRKSSIINHKSKILIIEWLDPIMAAGHWVPEMVGIAGGLPARFRLAKSNVSVKVSWRDVLRADPDMLIIAPCGFDIFRTKREIHSIVKRKGYNDLKAVKNKKVYLVDGNAYLTRPGPRIIDGIEILAEIFYPEIFSRKHPQKDWQIFNI